VAKDITIYSMWHKIVLYTIVAQDSTIYSCGTR